MSFGVRADDDVDRFDDNIDRHDHLENAQEPGFDLRSGGTDLFRAVIILLLAAAIGILVLTRGVGDSGGIVADPGAENSADAENQADNQAGVALDNGADDPSAPAVDSATDAMATDDTAMADDATATETTVAADGTATTTDSGLGLGDGSVARDPKEVEVLVLNATDQKGIAAQASELLQTSSYKTAPAGNATIEGLGSVIYYMEGYRADGLAVAELFTAGLDGLVQPYDATKPPSDEIGSANVIVVLGIDEAIPIG